MLSALELAGDGLGGVVEVLAELLVVQLQLAQQRGAGAVDDGAVLVVRLSLACSVAVGGY